MLVQAILEQSARAHPDKPAAWHNGVWKTYGELNRQADQVAAFLVGLGIKPSPVFLKAGDVMTLGITGLGEQRSKVVKFKA